MAAKKSPAKPAKTATTAKKTPAAPKAPKAPKIERATANGITQPREGSTTRKVWDIADGLSKKDAPASRADVLAEAERQGINEATVATQFQRWRTFHGIQRPVKAPKAPKAPAKGKKTAAAE